MDLGFAHQQARSQKTEGYTCNLFVLLPCRVIADASVKEGKFFYSLPGKICCTVPDPSCETSMKILSFRGIYKCVAKAESRSHIPSDIFFINGMIFLACWEKRTCMPWISRVLQEVHRIAQLLQPGRFI